MLLTKEVDVKLWGNNIMYYHNLGYNGKHGDIITVKVEDLKKGSHATVSVLCDYCRQEVIDMPYYEYNYHLKLIDKIACLNCKGKKQIDCNLAKYGVSSPSKLSHIKEKVKNSNLSKYGVDNYAKTKECREKMANTTEARYGARHYSQTQNYKEKFHNTCVKRYGESYRQQFVEKAFETFRDKTGYEFPSQSPDVREKITQSYIEHYGVDSPAKSLKVREKMSKTLYANSSQKVSKQQYYINELYQGILNFPVKYYSADIYLPNDNLIIEYDGGGHMLNVITGRETMEEYTQKEIVRNNVIKCEGYKQMKIISLDDYLPQDQILLQMLEEAKQYFSKTAHSWVIYDIDNSQMINAENKDTNGISYNFGELRRIKDSDLTNVNNKKGA